MGSALIEACAVRKLPKPCGCDLTSSTASSMSLAMPSGVGADHLAVLLQIGGRHVDRVLDDRFGADGEPVVEAAIERDAGEEREQDRRHDGDDAEQADDADMQLRAGDLTAAARATARSPARR